jgi:hypothetical protein
MLDLINLDSNFTSFNLILSRSSLGYFLYLSEDGINDVADIKPGSLRLSEVYTCVERPDSCNTRPTRTEAPLPPRRSFSASA